MKNDFKSFLAVEFSNYLQLLLSAGRSTRNHEIMLRSLDSFLLQNHTFEKCLSESIINQWLSTICGTSANKVSYIARYRGLSKYLRSINITAFEPEYPRCSYTYAPYVFSDEEWKRMIASADSLPYSDYNPESAVLFCILGYLEKMVVFDLSSRFKSKSTLFLLVVFCSITGILY